MTFKKIQNFLLLNVGVLLLSIGIYFFIIPNGFATGGVTGVATILGKITMFSASVWLWILNVALLLVGFIFLGKGTGIKTIYCSLMISLLVNVFEYIIPLSTPLSDQPFLELVYAMLIMSVGSVIVFKVKASSGGTEIVALILKKYFKMDVGKALTYADLVVALGSFFVFGVTTGLYSLLGLFIRAFIIDSVIESVNSCKYFIVITTKGDEIKKYVMNDINRGVTTHKVVGEYTGEDKIMLHTVCRRIEAIKLREKVREIDPSAFTIITTSSEIIGRGFSRI
ncbi:MAG: YitT family protein [Clostridia bacterium]|nr:YitT family protein [Clostridia bacterium]